MFNNSKSMAVKVAKAPPNECPVNVNFNEGFFSYIIYILSNNLLYIST